MSLWLLALRSLRASRSSCSRPLPRWCHDARLQTAMVVVGGVRSSSRRTTLVEVRRLWRSKPPTLIAQSTRRPQHSAHWNADGIALAESAHDACGSEPGVVALVARPRGRETPSIVEATQAPRPRVSPARLASFFEAARGKIRALSSIVRLSRRGCALMATAGGWTDRRVVPGRGPAALVGRITSA